MCYGNFKQDADHNQNMSGVYVIVLIYGVTQGGHKEH